MLRRLLIGLAVLLIGLGPASCSHDALQDPCGQESVQTDTPPPLAAPEGLGDLAGGLIRGLLRVVKVIFDDAGGTIELTRFKVVIPPGALTSPTETISLIDRQALDGAVSCELLPHGASFERPVTLTMTLKGTNVDPGAKYTIYWYDENAGRWVDLAATYDRENQTVTVELNHFSTYRAGRAGW